MSNMLALLLMSVYCVYGEECSLIEFVKTGYTDMHETPGVSVSSRIECGLICFNDISCSSYLYCDVAGDRTCLVSPVGVSVKSTGQCRVFELATAADSNSVSQPACENGGTLQEDDNCTCPSYTVGDRCETRIRDCQDVYNLITSTPGLYTVYPPDTVDPFEVECDDPTNYGILMMFRDIHSSGCTSVPVTYLDVGWEDYKKSISEGNCYFWLGLEKIHALTSSKPYQLHLYVKDSSFREATASYSHFKVGDEASRYMLTAAGFSAESNLIGDRFYLADSTNTLNGTNFCTKENCVSNPECGDYLAGGWWYTATCTSNPHHSRDITWAIGDGSPTEMKEMIMTLRPVVSP